MLTNTQVSNILKAFANGLSTDIKLSQTQLHKIGHSGGFFGRLLVPLLKTGLSLRGDVLKLLTKSVLIPLGLTAAAATDAAISKKMFGSGFTTLIISNEEINDIMKIVSSLEESWLLIKRVSETNKIDQKNKKEYLSDFYRHFRCWFISKSINW